MSAKLAERFEALTEVINEICRISGTAGASVGVIHQKNVIFTKGYGFRDVKAGLKPDENTIYYLASMSKAFTAAEVGIQVERGKLDWTTPISKILPRFHHFDSKIQNESNIIDWMSHRTGLAPKNLMWSQEHGQSSLRRRDALPIISYLEKVTEFRASWMYSNWGYAVADEVITEVDSRSWGEALKEHIFDPLGMNRTVTDHNTKLDNVAEGYMALASGQLYHQPRPFPEDGAVMEGAVAVQSCVRDLIVFYQEIMKTAEDQINNKRTTTADSPLVQVEKMVSGHIPLAAGEEQERSYGLGWILTELPGTLGVIGLNERYMRDMPTVGKGLKEPVHCIYHQGSTNSFLCSVHLIPKTHSGVIVLTNSLANNDAADWIGELLLETLLDNPEKNDYVKIARASAAVSKSLWPAMKRQLDAEQIKGTHPKDLKAYVGKYYNIVGNYCIDVILDDGALYMCFQQHREELYELEHYHNDVFSWLLTRDEDVRRGRFPHTRANFYLLSFKSGSDSGEIDEVVWVNDVAVPAGETFRQRKRTQQESHVAMEGPG